MSKRKSASFKETVVTEYLAGGTDHRTLAAKYNISHSVIHYWIKAYQGIKIKSNAKARKPKKAKLPELDQSVLPKQVNRLRWELRQAKLHNELLQSMIEIAEQDLGVSIRKKSGTKRS
jgi:transposase